MKNINNSKTKLRITFLMFLFCTAIIVFVANYSSGIRAPIQEIVPKEKISVYLDMESTLNGQRVMSPQIVTNMGKSSEFIAGEREGRSGTIITARPYQIEGMDSQEILIDFKVSKRSENSKKDRVILVKTVIARNREKSIILDERDAKTSEALRVLVTPYFGPPEVSSTNH